MFERLTITLVPNQGFILVQQADYHLEETYQYFLKNAEEYKLFEQLFYYQKNIQFYVNTLFMSESNIRRLIKQINHLLKLKKLSISTNPLHLIGDEYTIRKTYTSFFYKKHYADTTSLMKLETPFFNQLADSFISLLSVSLSYNTALFLKYWLFVSVHRLKNNQFIHLNTSPVDTIDYPLATALFNLITNDITYRTDFAKNTSFPVTIDILANLLPISRKSFISPNQSIDSIDYYVLSNLGITLKMILQLINNVTASFHLQPSEPKKREACRVLYNFLSLQCDIPTFYSTSDTEIIQLVTLKNNQFITFLKQELRLLNFPISLSQNNLEFNAFTAKIIMLFPEELIPDGKTLSLRFVLITDFMPSYIAFLTDRLYDEFGNSIIINSKKNVCASTKLRGSNTLETVILLSNYQELPLAKNQYDFIVLFEHLLSFQDIKKIRQFIHDEKKSDESF